MARQPKGDMVVGEDRSSRTRTGAMRALRRKSSTSADAMEQQTLSKNRAADSAPGPVISELSTSRSHNSPREAMASATEVTVIGTLETALSTVCRTLKPEGPPGERGGIPPPRLARLKGFRRGDDVGRRVLTPPSVKGSRAKAKGAPEGGALAERGKRGGESRLEKVGVPEGKEREGEDGEEGEEEEGGENANGGRGWGRGLEGVRGTGDREP